MCYEEKDMLHASRSEWLYYQQDACRGCAWDRHG